MLVVLPYLKLIGDIEVNEDRDDDEVDNEDED